MHVAAYYNAILLEPKPLVLKSTNHNMNERGNQRESPQVSSEDYDDEFEEGKEGRDLFYYCFQYYLF